MRALYYYTSLAAASTTPKLPYCHSSPTLLLPPPKSQLFPPVPKKFPFLKSPRNSVQNKKKPLNLIIKATMASTPSAAATDSRTKPFSVLFVCLGNICRSPAAEGVFRDLVKKRGLDSKFNIDSAGTINYHEGDQADPRMRAASKRRGIEITSISRPIRPSDFIEFDLILAMDRENREAILSAFERWRHREPLPADAAKKVRLMCSYCKKHEEDEVPDPYYGGPQGFEKVLDLLDDACESLLESILSENTELADS
ncbi:uncharacterized protein LOC113751595 [Coffea eugenioides]|uniref:acid phosphatase n=1 Tax=Coffea arabica TaxID=13443 RepID=A0A6P6U1K8_COFAR|nr:uncharacterized protein LOC113706304 [Coffea arabica]XP_027151816.1 uncharacterized protein LOC113751595 [Coffea eugenioides]